MDVEITIALIAGLVLGMLLCFALSLMQDYIDSNKALKEAEEKTQLLIKELLKDGDTND